MNHRKRICNVPFLLIALSYLVMGGLASPINMSYNGIYFEVEAGCYNYDGSIRYGENQETRLGVSSRGWPITLNVGGGDLILELKPDPTPVDLNRTIQEYISTLGAGIPLADVVKFEVYEMTISGFPGVVGEIVSQETYANGKMGYVRESSRAVFYPPGLKVVITTTDERNFLERVESIKLTIPEDYPIPKNTIFG